MEVKSILEQKKEWGCLEIDGKGNLLSASPDFFQHFNVTPSELRNCTVNEVIKYPAFQSSFQSILQKPVFFGTVAGRSCLLRLTREDDRFFLHVLVDQDEVRPSDILSFAQSLAGTRKREAALGYRYSFDDIIGESPAAKQIKELAARVATSSSTVLLTGESGTGKELFAQAIHGLSTRKHQPFVAVNCAAIPDELFESEVFGYEAGAFSGAKKEGKPGKIERAQHGTLFLDEISELPYQAQGKLLRVLQEREIERLGGTVSKHIDVRIIAATNRDLQALVQEGKFRQDLFYRLYVFELQIPPLRKRKEDILPIAHHFIHHFNGELHKNVQYISPSLEKWLLENPWDGNIRELKACIERAMNLADSDTLTLESLYLPSFQGAEPKNMQSVDEETAEAGLSLKKEVEKAEISAIQRALRQCNGDRLLAAQALHIHPASLYRKISKYQLK
ncbi:sigma-54 interaction domain-containing protein [Bacillus thermotolerans]|uniref:sigma-54 interaction domain-containing protein n=1 Tax=Bacillus thermotolerans TaxID=1221996 RepID=UPI000591BE0A|nr:sigma 54-interacting transcriptional regulator [Bacillus thermotolerans]KKB37303.1 Transcriptional regulator [Bacillus thermotolerans]